MSVADIAFGFSGDSLVDGGADLLRIAAQADRDGLDIFSVPDHPYLGDRLDAYATVAFVLGRTERLAGFVNVSNLPTRPAAMLARTVTSLSALSGDRIVLGMGAGGNWDRIADLGVAPLSPSDAVDAFEEAIVLIKQLSGGGSAITHQGKHYSVRDIAPAPVAAAPVWTGSVGRKSLAVTGRVADGWIPGHAADWLSERYRTGRAIIDEAAASVGREPGDVRTIFNFPGQISDRPLAATRDQDGRWIGGSVRQWIDELTGAVLEHGAGGFTLFSPSWGIPDLASIGRWGSEIAPAVREAVAKQRG